MLGLFHARRLRAHEVALKLGWDAVHRRLGLSERFYGWFTPAIAASDFALMEGDLDRALDFLAVSYLRRAWRYLAIVLHRDMPYVEGFGTYPFGEEWLFDAVIRSYLPLIEVAERVTVTVSPVLADQLEDPGTRERLREFLIRWRIGAAQADLGEVPPECREACQAELDRYERALAVWDGAGGDPLALLREAQRVGRVALATSAATHAVLPLLATREGLRAQLQAGVRSHRRRFGWDGGFWLPSAHMRRAWSGGWRKRGCAGFA